MYVKFLITHQVLLPSFYSRVMSLKNCVESVLWCGLSASLCALACWRAFDSFSVVLFSVEG